MERNDNSICQQNRRRWTLLGWCLLLDCLSRFCISDWIDPDTKDTFKTISSYVDGREHELVFSDEFNTPDRHFQDGSDPRWTAIHKDDYTNFALHYYNSKLVKTSNGYLNISTVVEDISFEYVDNTAKSSHGKPSKKKKNYQSGMLQGWNKFCFTGGIVEISAQLPGQAYIGGLWPAMWLMGNLARATYVGSSNNVWPWSYDTCSRGKLQHEQLFSACNAATHFDFVPRQGRGAPEVDILEAMPGKEILKNTPVNKPYYSASLQVAPGIQDYRPTSGEPASNAHWYDQTTLSYGKNTSQNIFFYGMNLEGVTKDRSYLADAVSANRNIGPSLFEEQHVYRIEIVPGDEGYIEWSLDGELVFRLEAATLAKTGAVIPEEPLYLLFNTAVSSTWGFPSPCPAADGCPCDCFDCRRSECACAVPANMCRNLPASMLIDYVRVYQRKGDKRQIVGCSTPSHPTKRYIKGNPSLYKMAADKEVLLTVPHGGGSCGYDADCGIHGYCNRKSGTCSCRSETHTGPYCKAPRGYDDVDWEADRALVVSDMILPSSLLSLAASVLLVLLLIAAWKYRYDRSARARLALLHQPNELGRSEGQGPTGEAMPLVPMQVGVAAGATAGGASTGAGRDGYQSIA